MSKDPLNTFKLDYKSHKEIMCVGIQIPTKFYFCKNVDSAKKKGKYIYIYTIIQIPHFLVQKCPYILMFKQR